MLCQRCGEKEATRRISVIVNGQKKVEYICKDCAMEMAGGSFPFALESPLQMMSNLFGDFGMDMHQQGISASLQCPGCGMTYRQFTEKGRFGCAQCYEAFRSRLRPLFKDLHYGAEYCGKLPKCPELLEGEDKLAILMREKESAVGREDYERAAALQKEILEIKGKGEK